jgi:hypothetical protein
MADDLKPSYHARVLEQAIGRGRRPFQRGVGCQVSGADNKCTQQLGCKVDELRSTEQSSHCRPKLGATRLNRRQSDLPKVEEKSEAKRPLRGENLGAAFHPFRTRRGGAKRQSDH